MEFPIPGSERYLRTVPRRVDHPLSLEIDPGSLIIVPNLIKVSSGSSSSDSGPSQKKIHTGCTHTNLVIVKSIKNIDGESRPGEREVVGYVIGTLGHYPATDEKTTLDGIQVSSRATWIPVSLPSPYPLSAWTYGQPLHDFINSVDSWIQVAPITFHICPTTIYRTIVFNTTGNAGVFATPHELRQLASYAAALKASTLEASPATVAVRPGGANDSGGSRGGPTGELTAGARISAGTRRPILLDDNTHDDDDDETWNSSSNLSDGEREMASLAAAFGGVFADMHKHTQETKKLQRNEMVQHWRLATAVC